MQADSIASALTRVNGAELDRAVRLSVFYQGMARSEAANSPGSWAVWENLRRRAPSDLRSRLLPGDCAPWWVRGEEG